jgi:hypothetical protein
MLKDHFYSINLDKDVRESLLNINTDRYSELGEVVKNLGQERNDHFHFSAPSKNDTWDRILSRAIRCLKMLKTCEIPVMAIDKENYKVTCGSGLLTMDGTVRFKYISNEYKIHITIGYCFAGGPWDYGCPKLIVANYEQDFLRLVNEMNKILPIGRSKAVLDALIKQYPNAQT